VKITAVRASWLRAVIPPERAHVSDFGRNDSFNTCLVEIDTDTGLTGLGEAKVGAGNLGNYAATVETIHKELAPALVGRDPRDITALWEAMYNGTRAHYVAREGRTFPIIGRRGVTISAISGVDIALWDLLGKSLGQPLWRLLGGRFRDKIPAYASGGWAPVGAIGKQLRQYVERGHRAVKMRVGLQDSSVDDSAARVREVRSTLGPEIGIMVDAHGTWSVRDAQRFARKVEDCDLAWLEEPVSADNAGGITETVRICALAAAHGLTVAPHLWGSAILFASGLHLAAATPCVTVLELTRGENPLLNELVHEPFDLRDGYVHVSDAPGLGLTLNREFARSITV
jgi:L-alanine-DL-glutamate epimerase-like enolase superfamily enzyme